MTSKEALDFLVEQTLRQVELDGGSLTDLQKRMMYFTESDDAVEDPAKLNAEFEAENDNNEYEEEMGLLLHRTYDRLKRHDPNAKALWDSAISELEKGDYYFLVLWSRRASGTSKLWVLILPIIAAVAIYRWLTPR